MQFDTVCVDTQGAYNIDDIAKALHKQFITLGISKEMLAGKKIVIKPNMVMRKEPEFAATTHPAVVAATARALRELGAEGFSMAESSGGPYTASTIKSHYIGCGMTSEEISAEGVALSYDTTSKMMSFPEGKACRRFNVITPIAEADVIINICKLKTHALTKMSCGVKNFYGVIPGTEKVEMHARFPHASEFQEMLVDLCVMLCKEKTIITVCDGIVGMEGNGPTGGTPRNYGVLLSSLSPFCLDTAAEALLGFTGTVGTVEKAAKRGLCPDSAEGLSLVGVALTEAVTADVIAPDTTGKNILRDFPDLFGGRLVRFLEPRPQINKAKCVGCGKCAASCPAKTIRIVNKKAHIDKKKCIHCYCCQELCPINSVKIKKNLLLKIVH